MMEPELQSRLKELRRSIDVPLSSAAAVVASSRGRRRRRRLGGAAVGAVLLVGGGFFASMLDADDASDLDTVATTSTSSPSVSTTASPDEALVGELIEIPIGVESAEAIPNPIGPSYLGGPAVQFFAVDGMFHVLGTSTEPPPLPDLDSELAEQFSPEVIDLIRSSGAQTLPDAMAALEEAGLLSEATEAVMTSGSEILGAFLGTPMDVALTSGDGVTWNPSDVVSLGSLGGHLTAVDGAKVVIADAVAIVDADSPSVGIDAEFRVVAADDVGAWETWNLSPPSGESGDDRLMTLPSSLTESVGWGPEGWVVTQRTAVILRPEILIPETLPFPTDQVAGFDGPTDEGMAYVVLGEDGGETQVVVPWAELPFTRNEYESSVDAVERIVWAADLGGEARVVEPPIPDCCVVVANDAAYLSYDPVDGAMWSSVDLAGWQPLSVPFANEVASVAPVEGGFVVQELVGGHRSALWWTDTISWRRIVLPDELADHALLARGTGREAVFFAIDTDLVVYGGSPGGFIRPAVANDPWVLASVDGRDWTVAPVDGIGQFGSTRPAVANDRLLIPSSEEWMVVDLSS